MFICTITDATNIPLTLLKGEGEFIVRIPVGYDDENGHIFSSFLALSPLAGHADIPGFELTFSIIEADSEGNEFSTYWDGLETKTIIPDPKDRKQIYDVTASTIPCLIDEAQPGLIWMTSRTANLPDSALIKYNHVCAIFREYGFRAAEGDPYHGRRIWMIERQG